jgi:hypothetical protein
MSYDAGRRRALSTRFLLGGAILSAILLSVVPALPAGANNAGYALQFDGYNDFVVLPETSSILGPGWENSKTVSLWVKPMGAATICANNNVGWCDSIFGDRPRWWGIVRGILDGQDRLWVWNYDGSSGSPADVLPVAYTPGEWIHITLVHGSGSLRAYRNGVQVGGTPSGTTLQPSTGAQPQLHLGGIINSSTRNWTFEGILDEVSLWSVERSEAEVQADLFRTLTGSEPGLRAHYSMSNGSGTILTDDGPQAWDGLLQDGNRGVPANGSPPAWVLSDAFGQPGATPTSTVPTATQPAVTPTTTSTVSRSPTSTPGASPTPSATPVPGGFPSASILDSFNRADGPIGSNWSGAVAAYGIAADRLDVNGNGSILWKVSPFGAEQEVYMTLSTVDSGASSMSLLLKSQSSSTASQGALRVLYSPGSQTIQVWTYATSQGWIQRGANMAAPLVSGDTLGARDSGAAVEIYRNGALLGSRDISAWPHAAAAGYLGLWMASASAAVLDDFGGGTIGLAATATPQSTATAGASATPTAVPNSPTPTSILPTATATSTSTPSDPGDFPSTGAVDNFNRANGPLGGSWSGNTGNFAVADDQLDVNGNGAVLWNSVAYGIDQEAFVTLATIDPASTSISLLLKSQSSTGATSGAARVLYSPGAQVVQVWTYADGQGWIQRGANLPAPFTNGDVLGARATSAGSIEVYRNGSLLGSRDVSAWTHVSTGGYIGLWLAGASNVLLDDFGGGAFTAS